MKKFIWISVLLLVLIGCGARKRNVAKESTKTNYENTTASGQAASGQSNSETNMDLKSFLQDKSLKIVADGNPYQLQYGGLVFTGSAALEFIDKKQEVIYHHKTIVKTKYQTKTYYQTKTRFKFETIKRQVSTERKGITFGALVWIVIISLVAGAILWPIIKSFLPKWRINF